MTEGIMARLSDAGAPTAELVARERGRRAVVFGALLRAERTRIGATEAQVARWSGLDRSYVSKLEAGARAPSVAALDALAGALDLDPEAWRAWRLAAGYAPPTVSAPASWRAGEDLGAPAGDDGEEDGDVGAPAPRVVARRRPQDAMRVLDARYGARRDDLARGYRERLEREAWTPGPIEAGPDGACWQRFERGRAVALLLLA